MAEKEDFSNNKNYQILLQKGRELFWKYGIRRVTVEEICREAGISKMTFYKFFPNKIELARSILTPVIEKPMKEFLMLVDGPLPFVEKVRRMFEMKMKATEGISTEFLDDAFGNPHYGLRELMDSYQEESMRIFIKFLKDSQKKGLIRRDVKIEFMLACMNVLRQLVYDKGLQALYGDPRDLIMEVMNFTFYGLSNPVDQ